MFTDRLAPADASQHAQGILQWIHRAYPNQICHVLSSDEDARPPRQLTPAFFGCYDWHSAVHMHWSAVRLMRLLPALGETPALRSAVEASLTRENLEQEHAYLSARERAGFERPYGLAWLLQLCTELSEWNDAQGRRWLEHLDPLRQLAIRRVSEWLPQLQWPVRTGEHGQTAFAMGLMLDHAQICGQGPFERLLVERAMAFYGKDRHAPLAYEPSGQDFLSPALGEADLMRRVLPPDQFPNWLEGFLPADAHFLPVLHGDPGDGKLSHLVGLNLSRAWMLEGIAWMLPDSKPMRRRLLDMSEAHARAGLASVSDPHHNLAHWIRTFALYYVTLRGRTVIGPD